METIDIIASIIKEATGYDATAHNFPKGNSGWAITLTTTIWDDEIILDVYQCEFRPTICGEETAERREKEPLIKRGRRLIIAERK